MLLITSSWTIPSMMQSRLASIWRMACTRLIYLQTCDILGAVATCDACAFVFALLTTQIEKAAAKAAEEAKKTEAEAVLKKLLATSRR